MCSREFLSACSLAASPSKFFMPSGISKLSSTAWSSWPGSQAWITTTTLRPRTWTRPSRRWKRSRRTIVRRERFQRLDGRVHVRGLRVVVVIHACEPGHELQAVLDSFEIPDGMKNLLGLAANEHADRNSREHIFQIVRAFQRHFGQRHDLAFAMPVPEIDLRTASKGALFNLLLSA